MPEKIVRGPVDLQAEGGLPYKLQSYGPELGKNKAFTWRSLNLIGASAYEKRLLIAVAMQETTHMSLSQRDASKDGTPSANVTIFNMNVDMISFIKIPVDHARLYNLPEHRTDACQLAVNAVRKLGPKRFLDFHRGGRTGYNDGVSYDCLGYRRAIATMLPLLTADIALASQNDYRIEIEVPHV